MRFLIPLGVFAVMVLFLGIGLTLNPREVPSPLIGKPAPAFQLSRVADAGQTLSPEDFKGQVALVNVWASWCVSCRQEHPVLLQLARQNVVPIYGLNYKDQREAAQGWLNQHGNPYIASAFDADGRVGINWGVYGVPETFVIDKAGLIRHKHTGPVTPESLDRELLPLIRQLQGEP